jgi:hypothetical protein
MLPYKDSTKYIHTDSYIHKQWHDMVKDIKLCINVRAKFCDFNLDPLHLLNPMLDKSMV